MARTKVQSEFIVDDVALAGNPTTTTQSAGNNTTRIATTAFVSTAINNLINSAPGTLDTLDEIAAALNDDPSFTTTVNNAIATKLNLSGGTLTGDLILGDNVRLELGGATGGDLRIYHSGSNSFIDEAGDGDLIITSSVLRPRTDLFVLNNAANSEHLLVATEGGAVSLYYDAVKKLETTDDGVTITNANSTGTIIKTAVDNAVNQGLIIERSANSDRGYFNYQGGAFRMVATDGDPMRFGHVSASDEVSIHTDGTLLVAKTSTTFSDTGVELRAGNGGSRFIRSNAEPILVNRTGSEGKIIGVYEGGAEIGSIGVQGDDITIGNDNVGLRFGYAGLSNIIPVDIDNNDLEDDIVSLGHPNSRFKAAFFSDGVTASSNSGSNSAFNLGWQNSAIALEMKYDASYYMNIEMHAQTRDLIFNNKAGDGVGDIRFKTGATLTERLAILADGKLELASASYIEKPYRNLYTDSSTATQYMKLYDKASSTPPKYLHFMMYSQNHSEYSVEVKIHIPTYSGFYSSYGTPDSGQGPNVEIDCGGLPSQTKIFNNIIIVDPVSDTSEYTEVWLQITPPNATTNIYIREFADSDPLIQTTDNSGWTTSAPTATRTFPIAVGNRMINSLSIARDGKVGVNVTKNNESNPQKSFHVEHENGASEGILISGGSDTNGHTAGILLRAEGGEADSALRAKGGIFFERKGTYGVGDLMLANDIVGDNNSVTVSDYKIKMHQSGKLELKTPNARTHYIEINGVAFISESFNLVNSTQYDFEYTVPTEGGYGNSFFIIAGYNHFHTTTYGAHKVAFMSARTTSMSTMLNIGDQSSTQAGAWQFTKSAATTLRIRKTAGTYPGSGSGFIQVFFRNAVG